ncbi:uncharacterized protein LOC123447524 [Hordeum vulgare subsp. vulgare]|uniref:Uncharacterized protein n=1 Tax=Hordeum vulgare subsp. vulgare TaxID=112509 RepID=A0A8I7B6R5_HORVV|nr:uncharacterized protein LOC123447524 [Hordeum vulgare subsp. vulgare]
MLAGVTRLKNDIRSGNPVTNLVGCHLWLQVDPTFSFLPHIFLFDNLGLGIYNKQHGSLPRVKYFDQASARGMIIMATDVGKPVTSYASAPIRHHSTVCYARSKHSHDDQSASRNTADHPHEQSLSCGCSTSKTSRMADDSGTPARRMIDELTPTTIRLLGPTDFCNYLRSQYPDLASDETTLLLKEINACCLSHLSTARGQIQLELMKFADKIIDARNRTCTCCAARGFAECPPKLSTAMDEGDITMSTTNVSVGHRLRPTSFAGNTSTRKRTRTGRIPQLSTSTAHILHMVSQFARNNVRAISQLYIDLPNDGSTTVFGERRFDLPGRKYVTRPGFQTNPWGRGVAPYPPQPGVAELIEQFFMSATHSELARNYLVHDEPRFIRITEIDIRDQLASKKEISHELMSLLLCRYAQLDDKAENLPPYLCWRHQTEPDFLTLMLSDSDFLHTLSIEKQLSADFVKHDIHPSKCFSHPSHVLKAGWF